MGQGQGTVSGDGRSGLGRIRLAHEASVRLGPLWIEPSLCRIERTGGEEVFLQPRIMQVLVALVRAQGGIVTRDDLIASCWDGVIVGDDAINRVLGHLRRLSEGVGRDVLRIETITRVGYRLLVAEPAKPSGEPLPPAPAGGGNRLARICVLPFANMSEDPEQTYFSDGISEDIITDLGKVSALTVTARNTAFSFKGRTVDPREIAAQLGVGHVLEGRVRKAGSRIRVTVQLIDGVTGDSVWADRFDRDLDDIFAIQDEISGAIVTALRLRLLPEEKGTLSRRGTENAEAYTCYLMARQYLVGGNQGSETGGDMIVRLCTQALALDPGYGRAWALLAHAQTYLRVTGGQLEEGLASAERAIALDPGLAEAHAIRARQMFVQGRTEEAARAIETALRLDPDSFEVNESAGLLAIKERRFPAAATYYEKAAALMETSSAVAGMLITCYAAMGARPAVERAARMTLERAEKAVARDPANGSAMGYGISALAALGDAAGARAWIERAQLVDPTNNNMRYNAACSLIAQLGDIDRGMELLEVFFTHARSGDLHHARLDPDLEGVRDDPRLIRMMDAAERRLARDAGAMDPGDP